MTGEFHKEFTVRYYEADPRGFVQTVTLLNYLQDAAGEHALLLGVSVADLRKRGLTWVLSRQHLAMKRFPRHRETVRVRTWPVAREGLFTIRDFVLMDSRGDLVGSATTSWAVLNLTTRRPVRVDEYLPVFPLKPERALDDGFDTLPSLEGDDEGMVFAVLRRDLDLNRHVNNTVFAGWALETVPSEISDTCRLTGIEIGFRAEALYGEKVISRCVPDPSADEATFIHRIGSRDDGRELARLRTRWENFHATP